MDLNELLHRHQLSLMQIDRASSPEEKRAHSHFASDYAERIGIAREELGTPAPSGESPNERGYVSDCSNSEDGRGACVTARVVLTPTENLPYKVVVTRDGAECAGHAFQTVREAEAFIRRNMPAPAPRLTLYDREPGPSRSA